VAVKVLHPGVRESMLLDMSLMRSIAHAAEWAGETLLCLLYGGANGTVALAAVESYPLRCVSLLESVDEFSDFMLSQLDLRHEAAALERLRYVILAPRLKHVASFVCLQGVCYVTRHNFAGPKWKDRVVVPEPVHVSANAATGEREQNSLPHPDVLVETFEVGQSMIDIMSAPPSHSQASDVAGGERRDAHLKHMYNKEIAALGLDAILKMVRFVPFSTDQTLIFQNCR
jgi:hypothetical protein